MHVRVLAQVGPGWALRFGLRAGRVLGMEKALTVFFVALLAIVVVGAMALLMALPVMWIVNYLFTSAMLASTFGVQAIGFWQAFWLNFLCGTLFRNSNSGSEKS